MQFFTAQGAFVATHETTRDNPLFPSWEFLRKLAHDSGAYDWLTEHGAELPDRLLE
jgi:hypothetical protein